MSPESRSPRVVVIGGPNGAGKTTCASVLLPFDLNIRQFVNADTIAAGLSAFAPATAAIQAGRIMLARLEELARQRQDFASETTLASRSFAPFLRRLQAEGYHVRVVYVWLRTPELAVERVKARAQEGGHSVPAATVQRRYWRGLANFFKIYRPLADAWVLCDNSGEGPVIVARGAKGIAAKVFDQEIYHTIQQAADGIE
jgi:predicted ABC-type ATPase